jgi:hypothetical protein
MKIDRFNDGKMPEAFDATWNSRDDLAIMLDIVREVFRPQLGQHLDSSGFECLNSWNYNAETVIVGEEDKDERVEQRMFED